MTAGRHLPSYQGDVREPYRLPWNSTSPVTMSTLLLQSLNKRYGVIGRLCYRGPMNTKGNQENVCRRKCKFDGRRVVRMLLGRFSIFFFLFKKERELLRNKTCLPQHWLRGLCLLTYQSNLNGRVKLLIASKMVDRVEASNGPPPPPDCFVICAPCSYLSTSLLFLFTKCW